MGRIQSGYTQAWQCDACGKKGHWSKGWGCYGSILLDDIDPDALLISCSPQCREQISKELEEGFWKMPQISQSSMVSPVKGGNIAKQRAKRFKKATTKEVA